MKIGLTLLFTLVTFIINAQYSLKGIILDQNNQPIPFVNIVVKHTKNGTLTDFDGNFTITLKKNRNKLEISLLGYETLIKKVSEKTGFLKIQLKEEANQLDEIIIATRPKKRLKKKENPAYKILKEVWKRRKKNGLKLVNHYQFKKHQTNEIGLNNLDSLFLKNIFKKDYKDILAKLPFNETGINYYLPLYFNETITTVYGNNSTNKEREDKEAEKTKGVQKDGFAFSRIANTFDDIDIYKNNVPVLNKTFVSPISTTGFDTYDYVLHDSTIVNNKKSYRIHFFPRRNGDLAFEGFFLVSDKNFAISKIKMKVREDINLNFARNLSFEKEYIIKNDSIFLPKLDIYNGDFTLTDKDEKNKGLSVKKENRFSNYELNKPLDDNFYDEKIIQFKPNQFYKENSFWKKKKITTLKMRPII